MSPKLKIFVGYLVLSDGVSFFLLGWCVAIIYCEKV